MLAALTRPPGDVPAYLGLVGMAEVSILTTDVGAIASATGTTAVVTGTGTGTGTGTPGVVTATATATVTTGVARGSGSGSATVVPSTRGTVWSRASTGSAMGSGVLASASSSPSTTPSRAAAATYVAINAAGPLTAAGAVAIALLEL